MKITYLGHGTLMVDFAGSKLLVDPFFEGNPSNDSIDADTLQPDFILLTHAHGDHVSDVEAIASRTGATIISNYEIAMHYGSKGYNMHPMNHGGKYRFDFGMVKYVTAIHTSSFPDGSYGGAPGGFVIWNDQKCIYIAGDTALTMDMKLIPMTCPPLSLAVLPIGDNFTMGYEDAAIAADFVVCDNIVGYHYDTFPPITIDKQAAIEHFKSADKSLQLPEVGASISF